jgi:hypothetical protein
MDTFQHLVEMTKATTSPAVLTPEQAAEIRRQEQVEWERIQAGDPLGSEQ